MSKHELTDDELRAIVVRANLATMGPWRVTVAPAQPPGFVNFRIEEHTQAEVVILDHRGDPVDRVEGGPTDFLSKFSNAEFVSHARTDVPALVREVWRLRARLAELDAHARERAEMNEGRIGRRI